jgi:hypothetical protein
LIIVNVTSAYTVKLCLKGHTMSICKTSCRGRSPSYRGAATPSYVQTTSPLAECSNSELRAGQSTREIDAGANRERERFDPPIEEELLVLETIESRHREELAKLDISRKPAWMKQRIREQLEAKRRVAREPHVIRLVELYDQAQMRTLYSVATRR